MRAVSGGVVGTGLTVSVAVLVPAVGLVALKTTGVEVVTAVVVTGKVFVVAPAGTVTVAGEGVAVPGLSLVTLKLTPPAGAALSSVSVPCDEPPPVTVVGLKATDVSAAGGGGGGPGVTVIVADFEEPL